MHSCAHGKHFTRSGSLRRHAGKSASDSFVFGETVKQIVERKLVDCDGFCGLMQSRAHEKHFTCTEACTSMRARVYLTVLFPVNLDKICVVRELINCDGFLQINAIVCTQKASYKNIVCTQKAFYKSTGFGHFTKASCAHRKHLTKTSSLMPSLCDTNLSLGFD